jgi:diguanylate cyclase (GGDEF)-like protein
MKEALQSKSAFVLAWFEAVVLVHPIFAAMIVGVFTLLALEAQCVFGVFASVSIAATLICAIIPVLAVGWLAQNAGRDRLTGLKNQRNFLANGNRYIRRQPGKFVALILIDLDKLKVWNDTYGHDIGNQLIRILANVIRPFDMSFRLHGDELAVVLPGGGAMQAEAAKQRIRQAFAEHPWEIDEEKSCSIGVAVAPRDGTTFAELYAAADKALYRDKHRDDK